MQRDKVCDIDMILLRNVETISSTCRSRTLVLIHIPPKYLASVKPLDEGLSQKLRARLYGSFYYFATSRKIGCKLNLNLFNVNPAKKYFILKYV